MRRSLTIFLLVILSAISLGQVVGGPPGGGGSTGGGTTGGGGSTGGGPGGGGVTPPGGGSWVFSSELDGKDTVQRPEYDSTIPGYRTVTYVYDWKTHIWSKDGVAMPPNLAPAMGGWGVPAPMTWTAWMQSKGSIKLKLKWTGNRADVPDDIWVKVQSSASAVQFYGSMIADNGQGDAQVWDGDGMWSSGTHLKRLPVNAAGEVTTTLNLEAKVTQTGQSGFIYANVSAGMSKDPRSIGVPINFKVVDLPTNSTYYYNWWLISGLSTSNGVEPQANGQTDYLTYATADRVVNPINYSDNVSLTANYFRGLEPEVEWFKVYQTLGEPGSYTTSGGKRTRDINFFAWYGGEAANAQVAWSGTHNSTSGSGTVTGATNATGDLVSTVNTDGVYVSEFHPILGNPSVSRTPFSHKTSGNFNADFTFPDGVKARAQVDFQYKSKEEVILSGQTKWGMYGSVPSAKNYSNGWQNSSTVTIDQDTDMSDAVVVAALVAGTVALAADALAIVPIAIIYSLASAGMGSWLDSSYNNPETTTISRFQPQSSAFNGVCWRIEDSNWQAATNNLYNKVQYANMCAYWSMDIFAYEDITPQVVDRYNDSGFSSRGINIKRDKKEGSIPKLPGGVQYYHYSNSNGSGGGGTGTP